MLLDVRHLLTSLSMMPIPKVPSRWRRSPVVALWLVVVVVVVVARVASGLRGRIVRVVVVVPRISGGRSRDSLFARRGGCGPD